MKFIILAALLIQAVIGNSIQDNTANNLLSTYFDHINTPIDGEGNKIHPVDMLMKELMGTPIV